MAQDGSDEAGPLVGWSLRTGMAPRGFKDLLDFPCVFCFKAVGLDDGDFVDDLLDRVAGVIGREVGADEHQVRGSAHGKYLSVTLRVFVETAAEVYSIYEAIGDDQRVRFAL